MGGSGGASGAGGGAGGPSASELIGWATQGTGTKGGGDLAPVVVTTIQQLNTEAAGEAPKVIHVMGQLSGMLTVGSNKTIIGLSGAGISGSSGVVRLTDSKNVIIKNLTIKGTHSQANTILHNAKNVWIDHNAITDGSSDLLRLTGTSDFVTISWNVFSQTAFGHEHMGVNIGQTDMAIEGIGHMNVTLHHNYYKSLVNERMPRARFGKVHTFNNLCDAGTVSNRRSYYAVRAGVDANVRSERNIYKNFIGPSWWWESEKLGNENSTVFNYARGNANSILQSIEDVCLPDCVMGPVRVQEHEGVSGEGGFYSKGTAFVPPYTYTADVTDGLEAKVVAGAGPK